MNPSLPSNRSGSLINGQIIIVFQTMNFLGIRITQVWNTPENSIGSVWKNGTRKPEFPASFQFFLGFFAFLFAVVLKAHPAILELFYWFLSLEKLHWAWLNFFILFCSTTQKNIVRPLFSIFWSVIKYFNDPFLPVSWSFHRRFFFS